MKSESQYLIDYKVIAWSRTLSVIFISALMLCATSCSRKKYMRDEGMVWHTTYHITYESDINLRDSILNVLNEVSASLNAFDPNSLTSRVNEGDSVEIDAHFRRNYEMSLRVNELSDGMFDPTLGPLITAWGFGKGHKATSDTTKLDSLLKITGIRKTRIENNRLVKDDPRIAFNFSAIAKGYGCDQIAATLMRNGVENFMVEIGGEIRCGGKNPSGGAWRVSIDKPVTSETISHDSQCIVGLSGGGLATSGNYRNFRREGGATTGHTISPRTGRPVETDVISATVLAPTAMEADALATAMMAMGSEGARRLTEKTGCGTLLVLSDSTVWIRNMPVEK